MVKEGWTSRQWDLTRLTSLAASRDDNNTRLLLDQATPSESYESILAQQSLKDAALGDNNVSQQLLLQ